jgi:starch synthase
MIVISHAFGNQNVRHALEAINKANLLDRFHTTVYWNSAWPINALLPKAITSELNRRTYPQVTRQQVSVNPIRETCRLLLGKARSNVPRALSTQEISTKVDKATARYLAKSRPAAVYAYDGGALETFRIAHRQGTLCIYELPRGYWRYDKQLLEEEAVLKPDYAGTLESFIDAEHYERKDLELSLADHIVVPSCHVRSTLQNSPFGARTTHIVAYGTNEAESPIRSTGSAGPKLRVLFVGQLSQRKGIAYLFEAVSGMASSVELTVIGTRVGRSPVRDKMLERHRWILALPHQRILEEMARHDVLVLPSLTEGFALVIGEALSRGLPVMTTRASGGDEIIRDGKEGFLVPIRSSEAIAEKLEILCKDRDLLDHMSVSALKRARQFSWQRYQNLLTDTLKLMLEG